MLAIRTEGRNVTWVSYTTGTTLCLGLEESCLTIARDWKQIIVYLGIVDQKQTDATTGWTSTTYCLEDRVYKQCSESKQAQPSEPPHFKEFRNE